MKRVLVLGAGLVTKPGVRYLLDVAGVHVTVADQDQERAAQLCNHHPSSEAMQLDVQDVPALRQAVRASDVVISLLPWQLHVAVAQACLNEGKHLVTTSYVSEGMRALDAEARQRGLLFLNEIGLDPGIDHLTALRTIDDVRSKGGVIESFRSYCGGLPAPAADTNPWRYKYSWSPRGAVLAARNPAIWLEDGERIEIVDHDLFLLTHTVRVEGLGVLEAYANRDALVYRDLYRLDQAHTVFRGTLRYPGHCRLWRAIRRAGLLDVEERNGVRGWTHARFVAELIGGREETVQQDFADKLGLPVRIEPIRKLDWIGLFSDRILDVDAISPLDLLVGCVKDKLAYSPGEQDLIVLQHEFVARTTERRELITSQLIAYGSLGGDSAMSRTVSLPAAIATRLLCEEKLTLTGVRIPVDPEIYHPVLDELGRLGIVCQETRRVV
ncbi:MAG: saccharopine dehydrogenase C-terminal domain-containing protein [Pseudomonadota bacterium]